jgi:hypothetical protein
MVVVGRRRESIAQHDLDPDRHLRLTGPFSALLLHVVDRFLIVAPFMRDRINGAFCAQDTRRMSPVLYHFSPRSLSAHLLYPLYSLYLPSTLRLLNTRH